MSKLLRANFTRLWKSRIFWIGMLFMFGIGLLVVYSEYRYNMHMINIVQAEDYHPSIDSSLFGSCMYIPMVASVFMGLFIGTEYSDGTIRNKLIVGNSRVAVYFANFIVALSASIIMHLVYIITIIMIGVPVIGNIEQKVETFVILFLMSIIALTAIVAIFLFISMLIHSKANASVVAILVAIAMTMSAGYINARLSEPEYYEAYNMTFTDESGEVFEENSEKELNPYYLRGAKRKAYEFMLDFLPGCQMLQIAYQEVSDYVRLPLYSLGIIIVVSTGGVICFRRQDLK